MTHGTRKAYLEGCRCDACRGRNAELARRYRALLRSRPSNPDPLVDAERACAHIGRLRVLGVGIKAIQDASDISYTSLLGVIRGTMKRIRSSTEARVLGLDQGAMANGHHVPSQRARSALAKLLKLGFRNTEVARLLGSQATAKPRIELWRRHCRLSTQVGLERLLARAQRGEATPVRPPPRTALRVSKKVPLADLLELRRRGVELRAGVELQLELAELRRMRRAS